MAHEPTRTNCDATSSLVLKETTSLASRLWRGLLAAGGWFSVGLGVIGIVLPVLPTTPFFLLACACFTRSSPRLHAWLLAHPRFGPYLVQWREEHTVPVSAKRRAVLLVLISFTVSIFFAPSLNLRALLLVLGLGVLTFVGRLRTS